MKKFLSLLLTLALMLSALCLPAVATTPEPTAPEGYTSIYTWDELREAVIADPAGKYWLENDINVNDSTVLGDLGKTEAAPISLYANRCLLGATASWVDDDTKGNGISFTGTLDGNNKVIDIGGKYVEYKGNTKSKSAGAILFYTLGGTVKNLTVQNVNIVSNPLGGCQQGVIAVDIPSNVDGATIENVKVSASYTKKTEDNNSVNFGGLIGRNSKEGTTLTIKDCTVTLNATIPEGKAGNVAGLVGTVSKVSTLNISGCTVKGTASVGTGIAGGMVGSVTVAATVSISNCKNEATLSGVHVGGQIGSITGDATVTVNNSSSNTGALNGTTNAGGIVGRLEAAATLSALGYKSQGAISGTNVGGLIGSLTKAATITANEVSVTGTLTGTHTHARVGYIALADLFTVAAPTLRADGGLDFNVTIDKELLSDVTVVGGTQVGMMITLSSNIPATGFTTVGMAALGEPTDANSAYYMNKSAAWNTLFDLEEDQTFKAYISNVKTENAEKEFSCVAYVTFEYNGGEYTVYSSVATGTPSALASAT